MSESKSFQLGPIVQPDCPEEWLEYFRNYSDYHEENKSVIRKSKFKNRAGYKSELFNVTEEHIDNPNYWINL